MKKRVLSLFMALALCLTLLPTAALAEENTTEPSTQLTEPTPVPQEPKTPARGRTRKPPTSRRNLPRTNRPPQTNSLRFSRSLRPRRRKSRRRTPWHRWGM